jgi:hypothetical protein
METKCCTVCKNKFPNSREYFYYLNKKNNTLQSCCISCWKSRDKKTYSKKYETKKCSDCKKVFPRTREYFYYLNKKENKFQTYCIECMKKRSHKKHKEYRKKYANNVSKDEIKTNLNDIQNKSKITVLEAEYLARYFFNISISITTIKKLKTSENFGYTLKGSTKIVIDRKAFERYLNGKETN